MASAIIDPRALEALLAHALHRAQGNANQDFETLSNVTASEIVGIGLQKKALSDDAAFYLGFDFAKECIAEILSDPLADHSVALSKIGRRFNHERQEFASDR